MHVLPPPLAPLAQWPQFVCWFALPNPAKPGKLSKFPCHWQTGIKSDAHQPTNWTTADVALAMAAHHDRGYGAGVGFVFTAADPFVFLDIDGALQPDRQWSPLAQALCARFAGAAVEVSQSGAGLHVIGTVTTPPPHGTRNVPLGLELYTQKRFVALTGNGVQGSVSADVSAAMHMTVAEYFPPGATTLAKGEWTHEPVAEWGGPSDDAELISKARAAAAKSAAGAFGGKLTFEDLWTGNVPHDGRSEADQSLANHLAFWTGKDCERMERLMRASGLLRDKWDAPGHANYLTETILKAVAFVTGVATGPKRVDVAPGPAEVGPRTSGEFMGATDQLSHFAGCTFVIEEARIYNLARNRLMSKTQFDVTHGGHVFSLDPQQSKTTTSAWDAFTGSRVNKPPIVDDLCFRPEVGPGVVLVEGNRAVINSYVPYDCPVLEGDATPFLALLARILPNEYDRLVFLHYIASMAQNPGVKFQWWPVLQGVKGNGKTFVIRLMTYIMGEHYTHLPNTAAMAKTGMQFNDWVERKLFIGLEEVAYSHKREFMDELKTLVTNDRLGMEGKGSKQFTGDNRANGIICTNPKDGVPIDEDERRYAIFYTAQQSKADLARDGLTNAYFEDLYNWAYGRGRWEGVPGFAYIAHYLKTYALQAALDPARGMNRAPTTGSTQEALHLSLGRAEQEILEAIEEARPGFAGGWVSSRFLDLLLDTIKAPVPRNKRRDLMVKLGYDWHPALEGNGGRVNDTVTPDNAKPKLYLRQGHVALNLTAPADIGRAYSAAQAPHVGPSAEVIAFGDGTPK